METQTWLRRRWWTLQRFGLTPDKVPLRLARSNAPKVFTVSLPKAGTHLLERALCLHPDLYRKLWPTIVDRNLGALGGFPRLIDRVRPGQVIVSHLPFRDAYPQALRAAGVRSLFLVRDPRDIVIARAFASMRQPGPSRRQVLARQASSQTARRLQRVFDDANGIESRIALFVEGREGDLLPSIGAALERYAGWLDSRALVVRFEDLVGPAGGGSEEAQSQTVEAIFRHLGVDWDDRIVRSVGSRLFSSSSPTYRKGAAGQWRSHFGPQLLAAFERHAGALAARYGYD